MKKIIIDRSSFEFIDVSASGNCFYEVISIIENLPASRIREIVSDYVKNNRSLSERIFNLVQYDKDDFQEYVSKMNEDGKWVNLFEIFMTAICFEKEIIIYSNSINKSTLNTSEIISKHVLRSGNCIHFKTVYILHHQVGRPDSIVANERYLNHYGLLKPLELESFNGGNTEEDYDVISISDSRVFDANVEGVSSSESDLVLNGKVDELNEVISVSDSEIMDSGSDSVLNQKMEEHNEVIRISDSKKAKITYRTLAYLMNNRMEFHSNSMLIEKIEKEYGQQVSRQLIWRAKCYMKEIFFLDKKMKMRNEKICPQKCSRCHRFGHNKRTCILK
jgi:hypothetical protein